MNERLNLQDIIDLLSKKQNITKKDAESFLRELFAIISDNIEKNESVKIKDFGAFKLVKVNARKSVDVNTGEAIEIAPHYKLSFAPEKSLREAINRPFSHFESVVLEEGVTFDNLENEDVADENDNSETETEITDITETVSEKENIDVEAVLLADESIREEPEAISRDIPDEEAPSIDPDFRPNVAVLSDSTKSESEQMFDKHKRRTKRRRFISLSFIVVLIIAAFAVGGYYIQEIMNATTNQTKTTDQKNQTRIVFEKENQTDSIAAAQATDSISKTATNLQEVEKKDSEPLAIETLEYGQTMRLISLKHYGHRSFWPYIYEENKDVIKNPNNVPLGTKLVIPQPSKYGIDPKDKASIEKAKALETKLVNEMGL